MGGGGNVRKVRGSCRWFFGAHPKKEEIEERVVAAVLWHPLVPTHPLIMPRSDLSGTVQPLINTHKVTRGGA